MQTLIFQTEILFQFYLKTQICMQKLLKNSRLLFLIISVCPNFLQLSIHVWTEKLGFARKVFSKVNCSIYLSIIYLNAGFTISQCLSFFNVLFSHV